MTKNWITDKNRFGLEKPPAWWLARLFDFDADLVVVPSRQNPWYLLARRAKYSPGIGAIAVLDRHADTAMLATHKLVPVTTMIRYNASTWDIDSILQKLRDRDMWAISGGPASNRSIEERGEKVGRAVEAHEAAQQKQARRAVQNDMWDRSGDAWRSYQARTGQRTKLNAPVGRRNRPSSGSTAQANTGRVGSGLIIPAA